MPIALAELHKSCTNFTQNYTKLNSDFYRKMAKHLKNLQNTRNTGKAVEKWCKQLSLAIFSILQAFSVFSYITPKKNIFNKFCQQQTQTKKKIEFSFGCKKEHFSLRFKLGCLWCSHSLSNWQRRHLNKMCFLLHFCIGKMCCARLENVKMILLEGRNLENSQKSQLLPETSRNHWNQGKHKISWTLRVCHEFSGVFRKFGGKNLNARYIIQIWSFFKIFRVSFSFICQDKQANKQRWSGENTYINKYKQK